MKKIFNATFILYLFALFYILFWRKPPFSQSMSMLEFALYNMNLIPFRTIIGYVKELFNQNMNLSIPVTNLLGNLLLFLPMGVYLPVMFKKMDAGKKFFLVMLLIILLVEIIQIVTKSGAFDIDDLILNLSGAMLGFAIYKAVFKKVLQDKYNR